jgi:hypothetical protein
MKYEITDKQLFELEGLIKEAIEDTHYDDATGATDDFDHVYTTKYFHLGTWIKNNLEVK